MGILGKLSMKKEDGIEVKESKTAVKKTVKKSVKKETEVTTATEVKKQKGGNISNRVLLRPLVTEKGAIMGAQNKYCFIVDKNANKITVKQAVKETYGIMPISVRTINVSGKEKRYGRNVGRRSDYKKAIVALPKGKTITLHEGV